MWAPIGQLVSDSHPLSLHHKDTSEMGTEPSLQTCKPWLSDLKLGPFWGSLGSLLTWLPSRHPSSRGSSADPALGHPPGPEASLRGGSFLLWLGGPLRVTRFGSHPFSGAVRAHKEIRPLCRAGGTKMAWGQGEALKASAEHQRGNRTPKGTGQSEAGERTRGLGDVC